MKPVVIKPFLYNHRFPEGDVEEYPLSRVWNRNHGMRWLLNTFTPLLAELRSGGIP